MSGKTGTSAAATTLLKAVPVLLAGAVTVQAAIPDNVTVRNYFGEGFTFERPVLFKPFPGFDSTYLVLRQSGGITRVHRENGEWVKSRFDSAYVRGITGTVSPRGPGEGTPGGLTDDGGMLGFAFHPEYANNRKYYIYYEDPAYPGGTVYPGTIVLAERTADSTLLQGSDNPQRVVLALPKPRIYHSGGTLRFGPDGYLYTAIGDGGGAGDPDNLAQNPGVLHGKLIRIDVDGPDAFPQDTTRNYAVPADNPFVGQSGYLPEIWATGLRSPWKWDFHPYTGEIWLGDVGQSTREKITRVPKGGNLGWRMWEGFHCFSGPCSWDGVVQPVLDLPRSQGISVTGGVFFMGSPTSAFHEHYIFGDFGTNRVWAMRQADGVLFEYAQIASVPNVVSFDKDARGRVFAVSIHQGSTTYNFSSDNGAIFILESPDMIPAPPANVRGTPARPVPHASIRAADVLLNPDRYEVRGLDGRRVPGTPTGTAWVREKTSKGEPRLLHFTNRRLPKGSP